MSEKYDKLGKIGQQYDMKKEIKLTMNNMKIKCDHCHETDCMLNIIEVMVFYCK